MIPMVLKMYKSWVRTYNFDQNWGYAIHITEVTRFWGKSSISQFRSDWIDSNICLMSCKTMKRRYRDVEMTKRWWAVERNREAGAFNRATRVVFSARDTWRSDSKRRQQLASNWLDPWSETRRSSLWTKDNRGGGTPFRVLQKKLDECNITRKMMIFAL